MKPSIAYLLLLPVISCFEVKPKLVTVEKSDLGLKHDIKNFVKDKLPTYLERNKGANVTVNQLTNFTSPGDSFEKEPIHPDCERPEYHLNHMGDVSKLSTLCSHVAGDIIINQDFLDPVLDFGSLVSIKGSLKISNVSTLVRITSPKLANIGKSFRLEQLTSLTAIDFPHLKTVETINWQILPILSSINFQSGLDKIQDILISDTSLIGFSLKDNVKKLNSLNLNNNRFLENISTNIEEVVGGLTISGNARSTMVYLPLLQSVKNLTIRDTTFLDISSIKYVKESCGFLENQFQQLKIPHLKSVGGTLSIIGLQQMD